MENIIFTDGSSRGNPGPGGWGAIIIGEDEAQNRTYKIKDLNSGTEYTDISTLNIK